MYIFSLLSLFYLYYLLPLLFTHYLVYTDLHHTSASCFFLILSCLILSLQLLT